MILSYSFLLFLITVLGGSIPLWNKSWRESHVQYILAFSGSFLLCVTLLHLIPETLFHLGSNSAVLIVAGFFLQQIFQRMTHGIEHGHTHIHLDAKKNIVVTPLFIGLVLHAFSEGLPLGGHIGDEGIITSLFIAIALHKLPEAMLISSLVLLSTHSKSKSWALLILFSIITPLTALLTSYIGSSFPIIQKIITWSIPLVAGAFLHIATTIFYESSTKKHEMGWKMWTAILLGIGFAMISLLLGHTH